MRMDRTARAEAENRKLKREIEVLKNVIMGLHLRGLYEVKQI